LFLLLLTILAELNLFVLTFLTELVLTAGLGLRGLLVVGEPQIQAILIPLSSTPSLTSIRARNGYLHGISEVMLPPSLDLPSDVAGTILRTRPMDVVDPPTGSACTTVSLNTLKASLRRPLTLDEDAVSVIVAILPEILPLVTGGGGGVTLGVTIKETLTRIGAALIAPPPLRVPELEFKADPDGTNVTVFGPSDCAITNRHGSGVIAHVLNDEGRASTFLKASMVEGIYTESDLRQLTGCNVPPVSRRGTSSVTSTTAVTPTTPFTTSVPDPPSCLVDCSMYDRVTEGVVDDCSVMVAWFGDPCLDDCSSEDMAIFTTIKTLFCDDEKAYAGSYPSATPTGTPTASPTVPPTPPTPSPTHTPTFRPTAESEVRLNSLAGTEIAISCRGGTVLFVDSAPLQVADVLLTSTLNGALHVVGGLLDGQVSLLNNEPPAFGGFQFEASRTVVSLLDADTTGTGSSFAALLQLVGSDLTSTLDDKTLGPFAVFAPTDAALAAFLDAENHPAYAEWLLSPTNEGLLKKLLEHHVAVWPVDEPDRRVYLDEIYCFPVATVVDLVRDLLDLDLDLGPIELTDQIIEALPPFLFTGLPPCSPFKVNGKRQYPPSGADLDTTPAGMLQTQWGGVEEVDFVEIRQPATSCYQEFECFSDINLDPNDPDREGGLVCLDQNQCLVDFDFTDLDPDVPILDQVDGLVLCLVENSEVCLSGEIADIVGCLTLGGVCSRWVNAIPFGRCSVPCLSGGDQIACLVDCLVQHGTFVSGVKTLLNCVINEDDVCYEETGIAPFLFDCALGCPSGDAQMNCLVLCAADNLGIFPGVMKVLGCVADDAKCASYVDLGTTVSCVQDCSGDLPCILGCVVSLAQTQLSITFQGDLAANNGVVHMIESVLVPEDFPRGVPTMSAREKLTQCGLFEKWLALVDAACARIYDSSLNTFLHDDAEVRACRIFDDVEWAGTALVPTDAGVEAAFTRDRILAKRLDVNRVAGMAEEEFVDLINIIQYQFSSEGTGSVVWSDPDRMRGTTADGQPSGLVVETMEGSSILRLVISRTLDPTFRVFEERGSFVTVVDTNVDMPTKGGVLHGTNGVLVPNSVELSSNVDQTAAVSAAITIGAASFLLLAFMGQYNSKKTYQSSRNDAAGPGFDAAGTGFDSVPSPMSTSTSVLLDGDGEPYDPGREWNSKKYGRSSYDRF
jgi:uncharacterized surface protein with fasciclin (FAS1) repeats